MCIFGLEMTSEDIIQKLVLARKSSPERVDRKDVARHIGIGLTTFSLYENGKTKPDVERLVRWAEALGFVVLILDEKTLGK